MESMNDLISRQVAIDIFHAFAPGIPWKALDKIFAEIPSAQPMRKRGEWILDRSGAYCCSECMEPCAGYVMMRPRDRFCKMCGADMRGDAE